MADARGEGLLGVGVGIGVGVGFRIGIRAGIGVACAAALLLAGAATAAELGEVTGELTGPEHCLDERVPVQLPGTVCKRVTVECPGIEPRDAHLRITGPTPPGMGAPSVLPRGTILLGMGGAGTGWYEAHPVRRELLEDLRDANYWLVQRAWQSDPDARGWLSGATSLVDAGCRYATLLTWIAEHPELRASETAMCATGNSGGSSEIAYALAFYRRDEVLDLAMPTGGPPHGAPYLGCLHSGGPLEEIWQAQCEAGLEALGVCPAGAGEPRSCSYSARQREAFLDAAFELRGATPCEDEATAPLLRQSPAFGRLRYPHTRVHFVLGEDDCGSAPPLGLEYARGVLAMQPPRLAALEVVSGAGHGVPSFPAGADAIFRGLTHPELGCAPRR